MRDIRRKRKNEILLFNGKNLMKRTNIELWQKHGGKNERSAIEAKNYHLAIF